MSSASPRSAFPRAPVYFFYGNKVDEMLRARDELLAELLDPETRDENLTEYRATDNRSVVDLKRLLPEISGDLSTMSFIPGARKVAVVVNPAELFGSGASARRKAVKKPRGKKAAAAGEEGAAQNAAEPDPFHWLAAALPETGNHLLILAFEDESEGREVNDKLPLFQSLARIGHLRAFRGKKAFFRIEETLLGRDAGGCLTAIRELWEGDKGEMAAYGGVVRTLRFMLQAAIARERRVAGDPVKLELYFPARAQNNLYKAADFTRAKYTRGALPYRTTSLLAAYERLLEVYHAMRPAPDALYVPDARALLERTLMELFSSPRPIDR